MSSSFTCNNCRSSNHHLALHCRRCGQGLIGRHGYLYQDVITEVAFDRGHKCHVLLPGLADEADRLELLPLLDHVLVVDGFCHIVISDNLEGQAWSVPAQCQAGERLVIAPVASDNHVWLGTNQGLRWEAMCYLAASPEQPLFPLVPQAPPPDTALLSYDQGVIYASQNRLVHVRAPRPPDARAVLNMKELDFAPTQLVPAGAGAFFLLAPGRQAWFSDRGDFAAGDLSMLSPASHLVSAFGQHLFWFQESQLMSLRVQDSSLITAAASRKLSQEPQGLVALSGGGLVALAMLERLEVWDFFTLDKVGESKPDGLIESGLWCEAGVILLVEQRREGKRVSLYQAGGRTISWLYTSQGFDEVMCQPRLQRDHLSLAARDDQGRVFLWSHHLEPVSPDVRGHVA